MHVIVDISHAINDFIQPDDIIQNGRAVTSNQLLGLG